MRSFLVSGIIGLSCSAFCAAANVYSLHRLVSDVPGVGDHQDSCLINPWGIAASATSPFWVSAHGTGLSLTYNGNGDPVNIIGIPGNTQRNGQQCGKTPQGTGTPTGVAANNTSAFALGGSPAAFLFSGEQGTIVGWNGSAGNTGTIMADRSSAGAVYKGIAIASRAEGPLLYAADFANNKIDVYDGAMNRLELPGAFTDPAIPAGFAPFNIQNLNGSLYVAYAKQNGQHHDDLPGAGNGYLDIYDLNGLLLRRLVSGGPLNSPWGMAISPPDFGDFGAALLAGNFGDGAINAFDPLSGKFLGALRDQFGDTIHIGGLWGLTFGNGSRSSPAAVPSGGDAHTLYFAASLGGPDSNDSHGLLGAITPAPQVANGGLVNAASFSPAVSAGAFTAIFGRGLAATTRSWVAADFVNGRLPLQLDGVSVTIDGKPAFVSYVSPGQIDVIAPEGTATGPVAVKVTSNNVASDPAMAQLQTVAPAFFTAGKYAIATHGDGSLVGPANVLPGATPARPGETIAVYGTGFGATNPDVDGLVGFPPARLVTPPSIAIAGAPAALTFAGRGAAGLDQINVIIPAVAAGFAAGTLDLPITGAFGTNSTQAGVFVAVQAGN